MGPLNCIAYLESSLGQLVSAAITIITQLVTYDLVQPLRLIYWRVVASRCHQYTPDNKVHGANMGPIWGQQYSIPRRISSKHQQTTFLWNFLDSYVADAQHTRNY